MKPCRRLHPENIEKGDRLKLTTEEGRTRTITVWSTYESHNFGWLIHDRSGDTYYLDEYDDIQVVADTQSGDPGMPDPDHLEPGDPESPVHATRKADPS